MTSAASPRRARSTLLAIVLVWAAMYASLTLTHPALLDDADSVHVEVAREMLLRHDFVTLYANGIRYLEKAPLLYWSMAVAMKAAMLFGARTSQALAAAARTPLALTMLALALVMETFARQLFAAARAGLYAALMCLSSFGLFIFTRITLPDAMVCLWTMVALYCFWRGDGELHTRFRWRAGFAVMCALAVLTKGLIGVVFPVAAALIALVATRGWRGAISRMFTRDELAEVALFLLIAAPWHFAAAFANPTQGQPAPFLFTHGHWQVPLPTDGNVRGWTWFYFMNEHVLRYLNLRVPRDYDTSPLWLFWGLCAVWIMPWSGFAWNAVKDVVVPAFTTRARSAPLLPRRPGGPSVRGLTADGWGTKLPAGIVLLTIAAALPLLFFSLSTRQEYYVLPALPPLLMLIAGWLVHDTDGLAADAQHARARRANLVVTTVWLAIGVVYAVAVAAYFAYASRHAAPQQQDLATLLSQNPGDYALSMGHFMDLTGAALSQFHASLILSALALFAAPLMSPLLRRRGRACAATLTLAAGAFVFLLAAWLAFAKFAPVLGSAQLAAEIAPLVKPDDIVVIHGEYEAASTLGFYLQRPYAYAPAAQGAVHILDGRSSNLWYGSFFNDAPKIFENDASLAAAWRGPQRVFLWQATTDSDAPQGVPPGLQPVYVVASDGGKEILSNRQ